MKSHRYHDLARQMFVLFWMDAWRDHPKWEDIEPWERAAWIKVACWAKEGVTW